MSYLSEFRATRAEAAFRRRLVESLSTADLATIALAADDLGWQRLTGPQNDNGNDFTDMDRIKLIQRSRLYWHRDPYAKQAVRLYTAYALGQGLQVKITDPGAQKFLDGVMADPMNRPWLSATGQRKLSNKLLVDGEVFTAIITFNPRKPQVRLIDPIQITEIITNPDDGQDVWYYRRLMPLGPAQVLETQTERYYRSATASFRADPRQERVSIRRLGAKGEAILSKLDRDTVIVHKPINTIGVRGYPLLTASLDWTKQLRHFMEDRAIITHAAAQFAFKKTAKGGPSTLSALAAAMRNGDQNPGGGVTGSGYDKRGTVGGATILQNGGVDTEQFKFDTMASNARADADLLKLHFQVGVGVPSHYFADPSTGNLATATSMERPVELVFSDYQLDFKDVLELTLAACLEPAGYSLEGLEAETPPLLNVDVPAQLTAITGVLKTDPKFSIDPVWRKVLTLMSVHDIDAAIKLLQEQADKVNDATDQATSAQQAQSEAAITQAKAQAEHTPKLLQFQARQAELQTQQQEIQAQHAPTLMQHQVDQSAATTEQAKLQAQHAPTLMQHQVAQSQATTTQAETAAQHAPALAASSTKQAEAQAGVADRLAAASADQAEHAVTQASVAAQHAPALADHAQAQSEAATTQATTAAQHAPAMAQHQLAQAAAATTQAEAAATHAPAMAQHTLDQTAAATVQAGAAAKHAELHADLAAVKAQREDKMHLRQHDAMMKSPVVLEPPAPAKPEPKEGK